MSGGEICPATDVTNSNEDTNMEITNSPRNFIEITNLPQNVEMDFYTQAFKALSYSPFGVGEGGSVSNAGAGSGCGEVLLPSGVAMLLNRQRKLSSGLDCKVKRSEKGRGVGFWIENEGYFRELAVEDIELLYKLSNSRFSGEERWFSVAKWSSVDSREGNLGNGNNDVSVLNSIILNEEMEVGKEDRVVEESSSVEVGGEGNVAVKGGEIRELRNGDKDDKNERGSCVNERGSCVHSGVEWLLGCRSKIYLTSERPSKKRKLLGGNAGLEKLLVAHPVEGFVPLCHYCSLGDTGDQFNCLIVCSSCGVAVHRKCYGVQEDVSDCWFCSWCEQKMKNNVQLNAEKPCSLCSKKNGALKPARKRDSVSENEGSLEFVHLFCCQWIPEVYVENTMTMEPIINMDAVKDTRRKLICYLCKDKCGACVRCSNGACRTSFHPICAREERHRMEIWGKLGYFEVELRAFCSKHSEVNSRRSQRIRTVSSAGSDSVSFKNGPLPSPNNLPKVKIGLENREMIEASSQTTDSESDVSKRGDVFQEDFSDSRVKFNFRNDSYDTEHAVIKGSLVNNLKEDKNSSDSQNFTMILKMLVERGKVDLKDVANDTGIPVDVLESVVTDNCVTLELHCKIVRWLKDHTYLGSLRKPLIVKIKSPKAEADVRCSSAISVVKSDTPHVVPVKSVPPRRRTNSSLRILEEETVPSLSKEVSDNDGMGFNELKPDIHFGGPPPNEQEKVTKDTVDLMKPGSIAGSSVHPLVRKKLLERRVLMQNTSGDCDGISLANYPLPRYGEKLQQLKKSDILGLSESSPEDEVEGELVFYQHKLIFNAVARKCFADDLISKVVKSLPQEIDCARKRKWDAVSLNQYLCELREVKKQGRKERRHKEAQVVLAAATAAAAASSRNSSFRKDFSEDSVRHEDVGKVDSRNGKPEECSQLVLRPKEVLDTSKESYRVCDVCSRSETLMNSILVCSSCKVVVHLDCYRSIHNFKGPWYCELCEELSTTAPGATTVNSFERPSFVPKCGLCGGTVGAFRKSTDNKWIHAFCAQWVLGSTFKRGQINPVEGMETISSGRDRCIVCRRDHGVCLKCHYGHCQSTFHPSCARNAGFYMNSRAIGGKLQNKAYCEKHSREQKAKAENQRQGVDDMKSLKQVRVELERLRLLCERIIKREKLKRELVICSQDILASKRDNIVLPLSRHTIFQPAISSESVTTSVKAFPESCKSVSEVMKRSDDVTVDSTVAGERIRFPTYISHMDNDQKTDDSSTSQNPPMQKRPGRLSFGGKQITHRPFSEVSQRPSPPPSKSTSDDRGKWARAKHTDTFEKELVMTSDQASMRNQRLPKGYVYVPIKHLSKEKGTPPDTCHGNKCKQMVEG